VNNPLKIVHKMPAHEKTLKKGKKSVMSTNKKPAVILTPEEQEEAQRRRRAQVARASKTAREKRKREVQAIKDENKRMKEERKQFGVKYSGLLNSVRREQEKFILQINELQAKVDSKMSYIETRFEKLSRKGESLKWTPESNLCLTKENRMLKQRLDECKSFINKFMNLGSAVPSFMSECVYSEPIPVDDICGAMTKNISDIHGYPIEPLPESSMYPLSQTSTEITCQPSLDSDCIQKDKRLLNQPIKSNGNNDIIKMKSPATTKIVTCHIKSETSNVLGNSWVNCLN